MNTTSLSRMAPALLLSLFLFCLSGCQHKRAKEVSPEELISAKTLGLAYLEENKLEEAEAEFLKIVDWRPGEVMGYANLGIVYLRMGAFDKAEEYLKKAIKMQPDDPDVRLILARSYDMSGAPEKAVAELEDILSANPGHVKSLYNLTELYATSATEDAADKRLKYMRELVEKTPANLVPRLSLAEMLIEKEEADQALALLEEVQQIAPAFPREAEAYFTETIAALKGGDVEKASTSFMIFHNYLKVTTPYQSGMTELKGPAGALVGSPVITFDEQQLGFEAANWEEVLAAIRFNDITETAGLSFLGTPVATEGQAGKTFLVAGDYNGDGDMDLYAGRYDDASGTFRRYLLKNDWGVYSDVAAEAGLATEGEAVDVRFADFNNDGFLDLFMLEPGGYQLYLSDGEGKFSTPAAASGSETGEKCTAFDYDHDGDLDAFLSGDGGMHLLQNAGDNQYSEMLEKAGLDAGAKGAVDACFADFDEDGDIDLFVANARGENALFSNQRGGRFREIAGEAGLGQVPGVSAVSLGDYNNDGFQDLFVASKEPGASRLYMNRGDGSFEVDESSEQLISSLAQLALHDARFIDFDNDGYLDLLLVGEARAAEQPGVVLLHNDGQGKLWLSPGNLPDDLLSGSAITTLDYNDDGDVDFAITGLDGSVRLLRNDGGNNHHYIKMKLVGLRAGSAKNNYFGVGAKVEMRSGSLYQSKVVTGPNVHFGLGSREKAEVIRIIWTNGVPQNMFFPATDKALIEEQELKGSCPFLYAWNGENWHFVKDVMWQSALGMPLGIMGENKSYAPANASVDYIRIPGEQLKTRDGAYTVRITGELWETMYMDKFRLIALDHPADVDVFVDERMGPPALEGYHLYQTREKITPVSVLDQDGNEWAGAVSRIDSVYTAGFHYGPFQGLTRASTLTIDPGAIDLDAPVYFYFYGWLFPTDASINAAIAQSGSIGLRPAVLEVPDGKGGWKPVHKLGFPMGKDKMLVADLSGRLNPKDPRLRISTNMQLYWDRIFISNELVDSPVEAYEMAPEKADLHYRGFSRTYRKGGPYGPHWFDYQEVDEAQKWRDLTGKYTRYGDVTALLDEADDMYIIMNAGDETSIRFESEGLPQLRPGWKRDFLLHSVGWVKDGDMNTAHGQTVEPLPFHGMSCYPYGADEAYPDDEAHRAYRDRYNTRVVDTRAFSRALLDMKAADQGR